MTDTAIDHPGQGLRDARPVRLFDRDLAILLALSLGARLFFLKCVPENAISADLAQNWIRVAQVLRSHQNPYNATQFLNWPPLWMQLIFFLDRISTEHKISFVRLVQALLITFDLLNLVVATRLLRVLGARRIFPIVAIGIALNPVQIILTCQHCNFDVIVAFASLCAVSCLAEFHRRADVDPIAWLGGCFFVGFGILTKMVPTSLVPLLFGRARSLSWPTLALGAVLAFFPVSLGISIIYVLGPDEVTKNVLEYRSYSGWFGITGLMQMNGHADWIMPYTSFFSKAFGLLLASLSIGLWWANRALVPKALVLAAATLYLIVPAFGPGYGPQYLNWSIPMLTCAFALEEDRYFRAALIFFALVATGTYLFEYGLFPSHGALWTKLWPASKKLSDMSNEWSSQEGQTKARLPIFVAFMPIIVMGVRTFLRTKPFRRTAVPSTVDLPQ